MLSSGHVLRERYRLEDPLTPDCLNVYKAYDTVENRSCLIKIAEGEEAARFEREAEAPRLASSSQSPASLRSL